MGDQCLHRQSPRRKPVSPIPVASLLKHYSTRKGSVHRHKGPHRTVSMRSVAEVCAKSRMRAPGREQAIACSTMPGTDAATMTRSAPRPPVRRRASAATSDLARIPGEFGAALRRQFQPRVDGVGGRDARPRAARQHGEHQADRPLSQDHHQIVRLRVALHHGLQARVERFHQAWRVRRRFRRESSRRPLPQSSPSRARTGRSRRRQARTRR